jgi:membrane protease YdiL (CAAX protease family)
MRVVHKQIWQTLGPIALSALSIFIGFLILQPLAKKLDPSFNLLANRGIGKIAFIFLVIYQILLLLFIQSKNFLRKYLQTNLYFFANKKWISNFLKYFAVFFLLHSLLLLTLFATGYVTYNPKWGSFSLSLIFRTILGLITVFFLAWSEELIFRGTLYLFFSQTIKPIIAALFTSIIFMFVHDLSNPLNLISTEWRLGLGLFLLGFLLNLIFIDTKKLYTGMGAHAGLVAVKVILRRIPLIAFLPSEQLPFWINKDLRMSLLVHVLFFIGIMIMCIRIWKSRNRYVS